MPRKQGIYKTIKTLKVNTLVLDVKNEKTYNQVFNIPSCYKGDLLKYLRKHYETEDIKIANIKEILSESEAQYFLSFYQFIEYGEVVK